MDIDAFWQLITDSLEHAPGRAAREHYLEGRLAALTPDGIVAFQAFLDQALRPGLHLGIGGRCDADLRRLVL
jgi:hypothetical protein